MGSLFGMDFSTPGYGRLRLPHPGLAYDAPLAHYTGVTHCGHAGGRAAADGHASEVGKDGGGATKLPRPLIIRNPQPD